jgi:hypothetical protein
MSTPKPTEFQSLRLAQAAPAMYQALKELEPKLQFISQAEAWDNRTRAAAMVAWATAESAIAEAERREGEVTLQPPASELALILQEMLDAEQDWLTSTAVPEDYQRARARKIAATGQARLFLEMLKGAKLC